MKSTHSSTHSTLLSYLVGFGLSVALTLIAFLVAPTLGTFAIPSIIGLALLQLLVQLVFFLHLGQERENRSSLNVFALTVIIILILVGGTLWIMHDLARLHQHPDAPTDFYEDGIVSPAHELH